MPALLHLSLFNIDLDVFLGKRDYGLRQRQYCLNQDDKIVQIDADLSHNPEDIPRLIEESKESDVVIGSRYVNGVNVVNWPMRRLLLSYFANLYAKIVM